MTGGDDVNIGMVGIGFGIWVLALKVAEKEFPITCRTLLKDLLFRQTLKMNRIESDPKNKSQCNKSQRVALAVEALQIFQLPDKTVETPDAPRLNSEYLGF